jgi:hypothetical protein
VLGFEPAWFHRRCGVDFGERWHRDPYYRHDTLARMKAALCEAFPSAGQWDLNRHDDLATISGCYGICVIPAAFGLPVRFSPDRWPVPETGSHLTTASIERLNADDVLRSPLVDDLFAQMETIAREWGVIHGYVNWQGVLNNAFHLRGPEIFIDLLERPDLARRLLSVVCDVMIQLVRRVQERQRRSGFSVDQCDVSNCTMNMVSPRMYREFLFEHDWRIAESFERFGVHTCNWDVTPYLDELRRLPKLGHLDMGMASDMRRVRRMFPDVRRAVLYSPVTLYDAPLADIRADVLRIHDDLAPCDVVFADIQTGTPDERVNAVLALCREIETSARRSDTSDARI